MSNIWDSGKAREEAHLFKTRLSVPSGPEDDEESRLISGSKTLLSGIYLV